MLVTLDAFDGDLNGRVVLRRWLVRAHGFRQRVFDELDKNLQGELPKTTCDNCGACCNAVSIFSLEYHRIVRDLLTRFPPARVRELSGSSPRIDPPLTGPG